MSEPRASHKRAGERQLPEFIAGRTARSEPQSVSSRSLEESKYGSGGLRPPARECAARFTVGSLPRAFLAAVQSAVNESSSLPQQDAVRRGAGGPRAA